MTMDNKTQEVAKILNMNEREITEYSNTLIRVMFENFKTQLASGELTVSDAINESILLWRKKVKYASDDLLSGVYDGNGVSRKVNALADAWLDTIYDEFNKG